MFNTYLYAHHYSKQENSYSGYDGRMQEETRHMGSMIYGERRDAPRNCTETPYGCRRVDVLRFAPRS